MTKGLTGIAISDTHTKHDLIGIDKDTKADFLFHSGDFSYHGLPHELESFNYWLGTLVNIKHKVVVAGNHECHDTVTEVLTKRGFVTIDNLLEEDQVMGIDKDGYWHWQKINEIIKKKTNNLNFIDTQVISLACTSGHRILHKKYKYVPERLKKSKDINNFLSPFQYTAISEISGNLMIPVSAIRKINKGKSYFDNEIKLAAWLCTDASYRFSGTSASLAIYQRESNAWRVRDLLNEMNIPFKETRRVRNIKSILYKILKSQEPCIEFHLSAKESKKLIDELGLKRGKLPSIVETFTIKQFELFLEAVVEADGSQTKNSVTAVAVYGKYNFLTELQILCIQHGYSASIKSYNRTLHDHRLNVCKRRLYNITASHIKKEELKEDVDVWCLNTPLSNFLIRRNGKCHFSGNCSLDPKLNPDGPRGAFDAKSIITNAIVLNQTTIELDGIKIYGEPRQPEFFNWAFNVPRPLMKDVWTLAPNNIDVLLTHGPPYRCGDMNREGENVGCFHQREWIKKNKPRFVICGHIHEGYGRRKIGQTQVFNASCLDRNYKVAHKPIFFDL